MRFLFAELEGWAEWSLYMDCILALEIMYTCGVDHAAPQHV